MDNSLLAVRDITHKYIVVERRTEMITIDYTSRLPLYEQIVERFQMLIIKGILPSGSQMPSVRALAVDLALNPNTIQKA